MFLNHDGPHCTSITHHTYQPLDGFWRFFSDESCSQTPNQPWEAFTMVIILTNGYSDYQGNQSASKRRSPIEGILVAARFPPFFRGHEAQLPPASQSFNIVAQFVIGNLSSNIFVLQHCSSMWFLKVLKLNYYKGQDSGSLITPHFFKCM